jgi:hypothetical protein
LSKQHIAGLHFARQFFVVQAHGVNVAQLGACRIEHKFLARLKHDFALGKFAHPDFGALQVGHDGHLAAGALRGLAHHVAHGQCGLAQCRG